MLETNTNENFYVKKISFNPESPLINMRTFAIDNKIPIIGDEIFRFLEFMVNLKKPKNILEIGTAIAYSSSCMLLSSNANLISIEKNENSHKIAKENLKKLGLSDRAELILGDATEVLQKMSLENAQKFDFVFVDGPKSHYLEHFKLIEKMVESGGLIFFDDVLYLGLLSGRRSVGRNNTIKNKMQEFIDYCFNHNDYIPSIVQAEDGVVLLLKK